MKAKFITRDKHGELYDCGRHGNMIVRELTSYEKTMRKDCLICLGENSPNDTTSSSSK